MEKRLRPIWQSSQLAGVLAHYPGGDVMSQFANLKHGATLVAVLAVFCFPGCAPGSEDEDDASTGGTVPSDRVGLYSVSTNYAELDTASGPLKFHFGTGNSLLFWETLPFAGDWDNDGLDTLGIFDRASQGFRIASQNDSDEHGGNVLGSMWITDAPAADGTYYEIARYPGTQYPVAGDWNGDGTDGVGLYNQDTNIFYLRNDLSTGPADYIFALSPENGFPVGGWPIAGDWDGDGSDAVGIFDLSTVFLRDSLSDGSPSYSYGAVGRLVAGDFDGDGVDSVSTIDAGLNQF
jgi:hypothetical protein